MAGLNPCLFCTNALRLGNEVDEDDSAICATMDKGSGEMCKLASGHMCYPDADHKDK